MAHYKQTIRYCGNPVATPRKYFKISAYLGDG